MNLHEKTIHELKDLLAKKEISAKDIASDVFAQIDAVEEDVAAFVTLTKEEALKKAEEIDEKIKNNEELGILAGIPFALKDNICTKGIRTTCSSKMLENFKPPYSATVYDKLLSEDALLVGKTNMDEFAMGSSTETSFFHPTKNPWDLERVPGGSSGGSAASVAANEAIFSLGTDTGGSIRQPAAYCGVVGLKPSYGAVSRFGAVAYASSLDQIGPMTKDVKDAALVLNTITGLDKKDSTSVDCKKDYTKFLTGDIKGMKIGLPKEFFGQGISEGVVENLNQAVKKLEELGAVVEECSLPYSKYSLPVYYIISPAECSSNMSRFDGVRFGLRAEGEDIIEMYSNSRAEGFGKEVQRRIILGTHILSAGQYEKMYIKAMKVRRLIKDDFDRVLDKYDCLLTPTTAGTAFKVGEKMDTLAMYKQDICTISANLVGIPALSLPFGLDNGLPVGIQFMSKAFAEENILKAAYALEENTDKTKLQPNIVGVK